MEQSKLVHNKQEIEGDETENLYLPPGFRFHPTDEELITHYLSEKVVDPSGFTAKAIGEVDLNKCEPWDLPWRAKMGEKEWYFFCVRDKKYPTGMRTNRATEAGYWKATGKDKEIYRGKSLVGMKKTLVFYRGRAPKGEKTNWVMHEYRLEGNYSLLSIPKTAAKNEWVISRVFNKSMVGKKSISSGSSGEELGSSLLPPLMDVPCTTSKSRETHVTCFSNAMEGQRGQEDLLADYYNSPFLTDANPFEAAPPPPPPTILGRMQLQLQLQNPLFASQVSGSMLYAPGGLVQLLESNGYGMRQGFKTERDLLSASQETGLTCDMNPEISSVVSTNEAGPLHLGESIWNY